MFWAESLNPAVKLAENTNVPSAYIIPGCVKLFWNAVQTLIFKLIHYYAWVPVVLKLANNHAFHINLLSTMNMFLSL